MSPAVAPVAVSHICTRHTPTGSSASRSSSSCIVVDDVTDSVACLRMNFPTMLSAASTISPALGIRPPHRPYRTGRASATAAPVPWVFTMPLTERTTVSVWVGAVPETAVTVMRSPPMTMA
jgi:hypothetical protein